MVSDLHGAVDLGRSYILYKPDVFHLRLRPFLLAANLRVVPCRSSGAFLVFARRGGPQGGHLVLLGLSSQTKQFLEEFLGRTIGGRT